MAKKVKETSRKLEKSEGHFKGGKGKRYKVGNISIDPKQNIKIYTNEEVIEEDIKSK